MTAPAPGSTPRNFSIASVKGRRVIDALGNDVGTIEDIVIEPGSWKVSGFLVNLRRDLATRFQVERKGMLDHPRIEIGANRVQTVGDNIILNIATDTIADALRDRNASVVPERDPFVRDESPFVTGDAGGPSTMPSYEPPRY